MAEPLTLRDASDEELVAQLKNAASGDLRAFDILVERHQARVVTNCRYISGSPSDAPDLSQEVFVKAFFALKRFEGRASFATWIQRIKTNHCINFVKKKRHLMTDIDDPALSGETPLSVEPKGLREVELMDEREMIRFVLDEMTENLRIPLIMCDMDGFSYQEIADELGVGLSAVKMRILRGRKEFRDRYSSLTDRAASTSPAA